MLQMDGSADGQTDPLAEPGVQKLIALQKKVPTALYAIFLYKDFFTMFTFSSLVGTPDLEYT